jgi:transposase
MDTATTTATTPAVPTATPGLILALDLGKYKSVACAYQGDPAAARFESLTTDRAHLRQLFAKHRPGVVVFEACALAGWVHDLCAELGLPCRVANTASEAWKFKHTKRKTDKDDALRLAQLQALGQLPAVVIPPQQTRQWRALIACRQGLVGRRCAAQNRVRALLVGQGLPAPRGARAWTELGLQGIGLHAKPLADCAADELWRGLLDLALTEYRQAKGLIDQAEAKLDALARADAGVRLLETIPGVGPRTAETVVAYLGDAGRFETGKQVSAYGGLVPRQYQSGESDRRGRITRRGPALLRKLLVECAWVMLRYNGWARAVYARLSRGKARKKQAIVALARKLLVRCWAMLRDGTPWRADPEPKPQAAPA